MSNKSKYGRVRIAPMTADDFYAIEPAADCAALAEHLARDCERAELWALADASIFEHVESDRQFRWLHDPHAKEIKGENL